MAWFDKLLAGLKEPSIIYMDNAKYHLVKGDDCPKPNKMKKAECATFLASKNIEVDPRWSAMELKRKVKEWVDDNIPMEVDRLANERGHQVVLTPPYHSDFQPIELVWALVKGNVGRQYSTNSTLEIVYQRLENEFTKLEKEGSKTVAGMIEKCAKIAKTFYDERDADVEEDVEEEDDENEHESGDEEEHNILIDPEEIPGGIGEGFLEEMNVLEALEATEMVAL